VEVGGIGVGVGYSLQEGSAGVIELHFDFGGIVDTEEDISLKVEWIGVVKRDAFIKCWDGFDIVE